MENFLLPLSFSLFVLVIGVSLFKKFLKVFIVIALIVGVIVFYSQDLFAGGIADCLTGKGCTSSVDESISNPDYIMLQNSLGEVVIFEKSKFLLMMISATNSVTLFDKKARKYDVGMLSELTIRKMIKEFFGDLELYNVKEKKVVVNEKSEETNEDETEQ